MSTNTSTSRGASSSHSLTPPRKAVSSTLRSTAPSASSKFCGRPADDQFDAVVLGHGATRRRNGRRPGASTSRPSGVARGRVDGAHHRAGRVGRQEVGARRGRARSPTFPLRALRGASRDLPEVRSGRGVLPGPVSRGIAADNRRDGQAAASRERRRARRQPRPSAGPPGAPAATRKGSGYRRVGPVGERPSARRRARLRTGAARRRGPERR